MFVCCPWIYVIFVSCSVHFVIPMESGLWKSVPVIRNSWLLARFNGFFWDGSMAFLRFLMFVPIRNAKFRHSQHIYGNGSLAHLGHSICLDHIWFHDVCCFLFLKSTCSWKGRGPNFALFFVLYHWIFLVLSLILFSRFETFLFAFEKNFCQFSAGREFANLVRCCVSSILLFCLVVLEIWNLWLADAWSMNASFAANWTCFAMCAMATVLPCLFVTRRLRKTSLIAVVAMSRDRLGKCSNGRCNENQRWRCSRRVPSIKAGCQRAVAGSSVRSASWTSAAAAVHCQATWSNCHWMPMSVHWSRLHNQLNGQILVCSAQKSGATTRCVLPKPWGARTSHLEPGCHWCVEYWISHPCKVMGLDLGLWARGITHGPDKAKKHGLRYIHTPMRWAEIFLHCLPFSLHTRTLDEEPWIINKFNNFQIIKFSDFQIFKLLKFQNFRIF